MDKGHRKINDAIRRALGLQVDARPDDDALPPANERMNAAIRRARGFQIDVDVEDKR